MMSMFERHTPFMPPPPDARYATAQRRAARYARLLLTPHAAPRAAPWRAIDIDIAACHIATTLIIRRLADVSPRYSIFAL